MIAFFPGINMTLTVADINRLRFNAKPAREEIKRLRLVLVNEISLLTNIDVDDSTTFDFVLEAVNTAVMNNSRAGGFINANAARFVNPWSDVYRELNQLLETMGKHLYELDIAKIKITGQKSHRAVEILGQVFDVAQTLIPDERIMAKNAEIGRKIVAFQQEKKQTLPVKTPHISKKAALNPAPDSIIDLLSLNTYTEARCKAIAQEPDVDVRIKYYNELKQYVTKTSVALDFYGLEYMRSLDLIDRMTETLEKEIILRDEKKAPSIAPSIKEKKISKALRGEIIDKFNEISDVFNIKIKEITKRERFVYSPDEKKRYTDAIEHANTLKKNLDDARDLFSQTGDFIIFKKTISELFEQFPGRASFETNRSSPWFRKYISGPFEQFKKSINQWIEWARPSKAGENNAGFFPPAETSTSKKFRAFQKEMEELIPESLLKRPFE